MTPEKIPMQDPGIWGYVGLIVGGFVSKVIQGEIVSPKWVLGLAGAIILILLTVIGSLSLLGIHSIQGNIKNVELQVKETDKSITGMKIEMAASHVRVDEKNKTQDDCLARIEKDIEKIKGVKSPRLGGGEMGDSR